MAKIEDIVAGIRRLHFKGASTRQIAEELGVSKSTVARYIKNTPAALTEDEIQTGDSIQYHDISLTKKEQVYCKHLECVAKYEDTDEGWVYHLSKEDHRLKSSGLWWIGVAYPESVEPDWKEKICRLGFDLAVSDLHDKDLREHDSEETVDIETGEIIPAGTLYKMGDRKKAHWHFIVICQKSCSAIDINNTIRAITNGPYLQKCRSLRNAFNYFTHSTEDAIKKGKYQYDGSDIWTSSGFHLEPNKYENGVMQNEIAGYIIDNKVEDINELMAHFRDRIEYIVLICAKPGIFVAMVKNNWNKSHPDSKRIQKVAIVKSKWSLNMKDIYPDTDLYTDTDAEEE